MTFEELLKKLSPTIKRIAYKLKRQGLFFNEEDLYQEALVYLWRNFKCGLLKDKTDSYILQGCYFYLKNYIRKNTKRIIVLSLHCRNRGEETAGLEEVIPDGLDKSTYLDYLNDKLLAEAIQNNGLNPREKELLYFYAQGLTTREIGQRLGVSHVRVVKLTKRIRQKCSRYLDSI
ncbi:MAG: sigma-70 family RNA polymerase sigma factor [Candidatus Omnitrophica bacterium]|nr:sigma-70 family RNA polymerase sigma factor [Candidatus Omnitrophota bacterium]